MCQELRNGGWTEMQDAAGGPYMYKGNQWIGYDDVAYVLRKVRDELSCFIEVFQILKQGNAHE